MLARTEKHAPNCPVSMGDTSRDCDCPINSYWSGGVMLARTDETDETDEIGEMLKTMWPIAGELAAKSLDVEQLDKMLDKHTDKISEITLAMGLVWSRIQIRSRA